MAGYFSLAIFVLFTVGGGALVGMQNPPGDWYAQLSKPSFNPPDWIFGPVWTVLYVLVAVAGWRTWQQSARSSAMQIWFSQLAANFLWSPVFFTVNNMIIALAIITVLLFLILLFIVNSWNRDRLAAALFVPYAIWVAFASMLNISLIVLN